MSALWTDKHRVCLLCSMDYVTSQPHKDTLHTEGEKVRERKTEQGERDVTEGGM